MAKRVVKARMRISKIGRCKGGFTLLEIIIVLLVISLLLAIVLPSFYGLGEKKLKTDARKMASVLRYLNDTAISRKETYSLKFDFEEDTVSWKSPEGEKTEKVKSLFALYLQSKGTVKEGQVLVHFGPLGMQENIAVNLRDGDEAMTITLNALSGRTKIKSES
ncbi:MAG: prepilin-type N-terminal cleavage/methylation domain-containing protein [Nitrospirota bacterium]